MQAFLTKAHRYFVYTSIAFTFASTGFLGFIFYKHLTTERVRRPAIASEDQQQQQQQEQEPQQQQLA